MPNWAKTGRKRHKKKFRCGYRNSQPKLQCVQKNSKKLKKKLKNIILALFKAKTDQDWAKKR